MDNKQILSEIIVQILGFLAIFFILKVFAWEKLLGAIDARRKKIADDFLGIEKQKAGLEKLERDYRQKLDQIELEARAKIQEAAAMGLSLAKDIQEKARLDAQKMIDRAKADIEQDIAKAKLSMRDDIVEISGLMTEKILQAKLDADSHRRLVDQFINEMEKI